MQCTLSSWPGLGTDPRRFQGPNQASCKENPGTEPSCHHDSSVNRSSEAKNHTKPESPPNTIRTREEHAQAEATGFDDGRSRAISTSTEGCTTSPPFFLRAKPFQSLISLTRDQDDGDQTGNHCRSSDAYEDHNHQTPTARTVWGSKSRRMSFLHYPLISPGPLLKTKLDAELATSINPQRSPSSTNQHPSGDSYCRASSSRNSEMLDAGSESPRRVSLFLSKLSSPVKESNSPSFIHQLLPTESKLRVWSEPQEVQGQVPSHTLESALCDR